MLTGAHQRALLRGMGGAFAGFTGAFFGVGRNPNNLFSVGIHAGSIPSQVAHNAGTILGGGLRSTAGLMVSGIPLVGKSMAQGLGLVGGSGSAYGAWRAEEQALENKKRVLADGRSKPGRFVGDPEAFLKDYDGYIKQTSNYRKGLRWADPAHNQRKFGARSAGGHLNKMGRNLLFSGPASPTSIGINSLIAGIASGDDVFDPRTGVAHHFAAGVTGEIGGMTGMGVGAALARKMVPSGVLAPIIGAGSGLMLGAMAGMALIDKVHDISAFGAKHGRFAMSRKSTFQDSETALTMRQRAMESINRSQFAVRSSLGQESLAFHS